MIYLWLLKFSQSGKNNIEGLCARRRLKHSHQQETWLQCSSMKRHHKNGKICRRKFNTTHKQLLAASRLLTLEVKPAVSSSQGREEGALLTPPRKTFAAIGVNGWMRATLWSAFGYNCNIDVHLSVTTHHRPEPNMPDINKTVISSVLIISDPRYRREADTRLARRAGRADSLGLYWHLSSVRVSEARTRLGEVNMTKQISSKHHEETCIRLLAAPTSHALNKD